MAAQARLRYRSGTDKKAELRKAKKGKSSSGSGPGMYPFTVWEGRNSWAISFVISEACNGPAIVLIQIYFVTAVTALYVKYEKEKVGIWPEINE
uniref:Uncharacterized protein n=1 Tax=Salix viminalis TaxID=40686 RepID=A0A6N2M348_SALVM